jgi:hypothetical protein
VPSVVRRTVLLALCGLVVLAGVTLASTGGAYTGTTSQTYSGRALKFGLTATGTMVTSVGINAVFTAGRSKCASFFLFGDNLARSLGFKGFRIKNHKFSAKAYSVSGSERLTIEGQFKGKTVTGSFTDLWHTAGGSASVHCGTGKVNFEARS